MAFVSRQFISSQFIPFGLPWKQEHPQRPSQLWFFCIAMFVVFLRSLMLKPLYCKCKWGNLCCVLDFKGWFRKICILFLFSLHGHWNRFDSFCNWSGRRFRAPVCTSERPAKTMTRLQDHMYCILHPDDARCDVRKVLFFLHIHLKCWRWIFAKVSYLEQNSVDFPASVSVHKWQDFCCHNF